MNPENKLVELQQTLYTSSNPTRRWLHCTRRDWIFGALRHTVGERHERAIEVGPGSGIYLPTLAQFYDEVVALDIEQVYLDHLSHLTGIHKNLALIIDDITASNLPDATFDLVLCTDHRAFSGSAPRSSHAEFGDCWKQP